MYVKSTAPHLKKLDERDHKMIFVAYERGSKAYRAYDPQSQLVHVTRDVMFDEQATWDCSNGTTHGMGAIDGNGDIFTIEYMTVGWQSVGSGDRMPEDLEREV